MPVISALLRQAPSVRARRSLRAVREIQVGSGVLKQSDARTAIRDWERDAGAGQRVARPKTIADLLTRAASAGFQVIREPRREATS